MGTQTSSGGTQVVSTNPPSYQQPYLEEGLGAARGLFQEGGPQQYQGNTVVPFSTQTEQALQGITDRATNGSPVIGAAQNFVTNGLNTPVTSTFGAGINPNLDAMFKHAADQSYNTLTSQFARSGRNVDAAAPAQADMLSNLAATMYGNAYDQEANRQLQDLTSQRANQTNLLNFASPLAESDYRDLSALQGVGQTVEDKANQVIADNVQRWNYDQQQPQNALDTYLSRISGNIGSVKTDQLPNVTRNATAGGLGGALAGSQLGSLFGGNGNIYGALIGGLLGAYG